MHKPKKAKQTKSIESWSKSLLIKALSLDSFMIPVMLNTLTSDLCVIP